MPKLFGNVDCPTCGGYGWTEPDNVPPGSYERIPCPDCCCPECHAHVAAGDICLPSCDRGAVETRVWRLVDEARAVS